MINFNDVRKEDIIQIGHKFLVNLDRIFLIGGSVSGKTNSLFNLISYEPNIDKIYLHAKDPYEVKYQF